MTIGKSRRIESVPKVSEFSRICDFWHKPNCLALLIQAVFPAQININAGAQGKLVDRVEPFLGTALYFDPFVPKRHICQNARFKIFLSAVWVRKAQVNKPARPQEDGGRYPPFGYGAKCQVRKSLIAQSVLAPGKVGFQAAGKMVGKILTPGKPELPFAGMRPLCVQFYGLRGGDEIILEEKRSHAEFALGGNLWNAAKKKAKEQYGEDDWVFH